MSLEVEDVHRGQEHHSDCRLKQLQPGYSSEELNVWQGVNHRVFLRGQVRVSDQSGDFRCDGFTTTPKDWGVS